MSGNLRAPQKLWDDEAVVGTGGSKASHLFVSAGANNDVLITAKTAGVAGNSIGFRFDTNPPTTNTTTCETLGLAPPQFKIHLATNGTSTANQVIAAIAANADANALVTATLVTDSSGAGFPTGQSFTNLDGGLDHGSQASAAGNIGPATNVALFLKCDGAATFMVQASATALQSIGRNGVPTADSDWYDYLRVEALDENEATLVRSTLVFAGADAVSVDLSPFAPTFLRVVRTDDGDEVHVTAFSVSVG